MKALVSHDPGGPETLRYQEIADPVPGPGKLRIAVKAVGVNFPDFLIIQDKYQFKPPRPFSPGLECAGIVDALGEGVEGFAVGDRVLSMTGSGGMAEKVVTGTERTVKIPDSMPFDEAAAFLLTYGTSHHALLDRGELRAGDTLLVLGAAGGVGIAALEIGAAYGARVIAAVSSEEKLAIAKRHGASAGFVYPAGPFDRDGKKALAAAFKDICGPDGADVIYDPVGGDYAEPALRAIAWRGRYLVVGFPAGIPSIPLNLTLLKGCDIRGVFWGDFTAREPANSAASIADLVRLYGEGKVKPEISARFPLERGAEAISLLASRQATGKVIVTVP